MAQSSRRPVLRAAQPGLRIEHGREKRSDGWGRNLPKQAKRRQRPRGHPQRTWVTCGSVKEPGLIGYRTHCPAGEVESQLSIFFSGSLVAFACTGTLIGADGLGASTDVLRVTRPVPGAHSRAPPTFRQDVAAIFRCRLAETPSGEAAGWQAGRLAVSTGRGSLGPNDPCP